MTILTFEINNIILSQVNLQVCDFRTCTPYQEYLWGLKKSYITKHISEKIWNQICLVYYPIDNHIEGL